MAEPKDKNIAAGVTVTPVSDASHEEKGRADISTQAQHAPNSVLGRWAPLVLDALYILIPIALICKTSLCIVAAHLDRMAMGSKLDMAHAVTKYLIRFNNQLTTLFTLIFGTIVADLVRRIALWRAQNGASVAELEQWQASITLKDTVKAIWSLRLFTATSSVLVLVWSWYYLGSQASTREYTLQDGGSPHHLAVTFPNAMNTSPFSEGYYQNWTNSDKAILNAKFTTSWTSSQTTGHDEKGFALIPCPRFLGDSKPDHQGYLSVGSQAKAPVYTSFVGVQIYAGFPNIPSDYSNIWTDRVLGKLHLSSFYLDTTCNAAVLRNVSEFPTGILEEFSISINLTQLDTAIVESNTQAQADVTSIDIWYRVESNDSLIQAFSTTCTVSTYGVELEANCAVAGCTASKVKQTSFDVPGRTVLSKQPAASRFFDDLLKSTGTPSDLSDLTPLEYSLFYGAPATDPVSGATIYDLDILEACLSDNIQVTARGWNLSISDTQVRCQGMLQVVADTRARYTVMPMLNTYLTIYQQAQISKSLVINIPDKFAPDSTLLFITGANSTPLLTVADLKGTYYLPHYALSVPWIIIDYLSCFLLLALALISAYLRRRTFAPNIFGFVSSMTIDNPHITQPSQESSVPEELDGMKRAMMLKKVKVQFTDGDKAHEVGGKLSLVQVDYPGLGAVHKLHKTNSRR